MNLLHHLPLLAQTDYESSGSSAAGGIVGAIIGLIFFVLYLGVIIVVIAGIWKVFVKAGKPGWAAIVPIYNGMVLSEIGGNPAWWGILLIVPLANVIFAILIIIGVGKAFGKDGGFIAGLILLSPIFFPILGFGKSQYIGAPGGYGGYPPGGGGYGGTLPPGGYPAQGGYPPPPAQGGYPPQGPGPTV